MKDNDKAPDGEPVPATAQERELSREDARLDALWRETFGEPMPILGAPGVVTAILREHGVAVRQSPRNNSKPPRD